ncbi:MAG: DNA alkylation repair protein [Planctomycetota bacterium]|jgi:3-methyladenine DNA glycosylase AlkD
MASARKLRSIVDEIRSFCRSNSDKKQAERYARFFTEGYDAYGVHDDVLMRKKEELVEQCREVLSLQDAVKLGAMLLRSGKYEEASLAILLIQPYEREFTRDAFQGLGRWLEKGIRNWAHTDVLCGRVLCRFFEEKIVEIEDMASWRESASKWKRRAVPVTMVELLRTARGIKPLLDFVDPMMMDEERFVQQGLGWLLREAWKKRPGPVESFLLKWKDSAPRKIYQYATEKMTKQQKARYRRQRKK